MTTFAPVYRLAVYAPRSVDPAEADVLRPSGNIVENGDWETNVTGGVVLQDSNTMTKDATHVFSGVAAAKLFYNGTLANSGIFLRKIDTTRFPATAGTTYLIDLWMYAEGTAIGKPWEIQFEFYDGGGSVLSNPISPVFTLAAGWQKLRFSATAPASTASMLLYITVNGTPASHTVWLDAVWCSVDGVPAHHDVFQVSTQGGDPAWKPYLVSPTGRRGKIDPLKKSTDTGVMTFELHDPALAYDDQLQRWFTAYLSGSGGRIRSGGLLVRTWESLDGGVTFSPFYAGRLRTVAQANPSKYQLGVRELTDDLQAAMFVGRPHSSVASYAAFQPVLPAVGQSIAYGTASKVVPLTGTIRRIATNYGDVRAFYLDQTSGARGSNTVTTNLMEAAHFAPGDLMFAEDPSLNNARLRLKNLSGGAVGYFYCSFTLTAETVYLPDVAQVPLSGAAFLDGKHYKILIVGIQKLGTDDVGYMDYPALGQTCEAWVEIEQKATGASPLFIGDIHPATLWKNMLEGKFGYLWSPQDPKPPGTVVGAPRLPIAYDAAKFAALEADGRFPLMRFKVTEAAPRGRWIAENILLATNLAYYLDGSGQVVPVDLRTPTDVSAFPLISDADLRVGASKEWSYDRGRAVTRADVSIYADVLKTNGAVLNSLNNDPAMWPTLSADTYGQEVEQKFTVLDLGNIDLGDAPITLDLKGFRYMADETVGGQPRKNVYKRAAISLAIDTAQPFGSGAPTIALSCKRGSNGDAQLGEVRRLSVRSVPDPSTGRLGGTRAVRVLDRAEKDGWVDITVMDLGLTVAASVPTLGVPTKEFTNPFGGASVAVTLNTAGDPAEVHYAVTATSVGSAPGATDPLWTQVPSGLVRASATVSFRGLPAGLRVWVRGRSRPDSRGTYQLPSAWAAASSPGYVDLVALEAPYALASSLIGSRSFRVAWTLIKNWFLHSEELGDASWTTFHASISSNTTQAPNGQTTGDTIVEDSGNFAHQARNNTGIAITSAEFIAGSIFFKAKERTKVALSVINGGDGFFATWNLGTGALITSGVTGAGVLSNTSITDYGGGWFRVAARGQINAGKTTAFLVPGLCDAGGNQSYAGDGTSGAYAWGAMFERSVAAASLVYVPTVSVEAELDLPIEVLLMTPTGDPRVVVARIPGGSKYFDFPSQEVTGLVLAASTTYRAGFRHYNAPNSFSAENTIDVATNTTDPVPDLPHPPRQMF